MAAGQHWIWRTIWIVGGALAVLMISVIAPTCWMSEKHPLAGEIAKAASCPEFWFNRYQTFVVGIGTILAALIVLRPALTQAREMRRQTATSSLQLLRTEIDNYQNEYSVNNSIARVENGVHQLSDRARSLIETLNAEEFRGLNFINPDQDAGDIALSMDRFSRLNIVAPAVSKLRMDLVLAAAAVTITTRQVKSALTDLQRGDAVAERAPGEGPTEPADVTAAVDALNHDCQHLMATAEAWRAAIASHLQDATRAAEQANAIATGRAT